MDVVDPELEAVERVFTSLAVATTDEQFQSVLSTLLPGLLSALPTPSPAARGKIMEALQHINTRLKAAPAVQLPLSKLIELFKAESTKDISRNFVVTGGYLERAFDRAPVAEKPAVALELIVGAGSYPKTHLSPVMRLAIRSVACINSQEKRQSMLKELRARQSSPRDLAYFVGISLRGLLRELSPALTDLELIGLVSFLSELSPTTVSPHLIVAAADVKSSALASAGDVALKRLGGSADIEKTILVDSMFNLFERKSVNLRCNILSRVLLRSTAAADRFPGNLKIIAESVNGPESSPKLRSLGMSFVSWVISHGAPDNLQTYGPILLAGIMKVIEDVHTANFPVSVRTFAFTAISDFALRRREFFSEDLEVPRLCFRIGMDKSVSEEIRSAAIQTLSSLSLVYENSSAETKSVLLDQLKTLFKGLETIPIPMCTVALKLINHWFPFSDPEARHLCILAASDYRPEIEKVGRNSLLPTRFKGDDFATARKQKHDYPHFGEMLSVSEKNQIELQQYSERHRSAPIRPLEANRLKETIWLLLRCFEYSISGGGSASMKVDHDLNTRKAIEEDDVLVGQIGRLFTLCHNVLLACKTSLRDKRVSGLADTCTVAVLHLLETGAIRREVRPLSMLSNDDQSALWEVAKERSGLALDALSKYSAYLFHHLESGAEDALSKLVGPAVKELCSVESAKQLDLSQFVLVAEILRGLNASELQTLNLSIDERKSVRTTIFSIIGDRAAPGHLRTNVSRALGSFLQAREVVDYLLINENRNLDSESVVSHVTSVLCDKNTSPQVADAAATAVSKMFLLERSGSHVELVVQSFISAGETHSDENLSFAVGEGLIRVVYGQEMIGGKGILDDNASSEEVLDLLVKKWAQTSFDESTLNLDQTLIKHVFAKCCSLCRHVKPSARSAGCVYLFSLLRHVERLALEPSFMASTHAVLKEAIQESLSDCQASFSLLLSEKSDFTQQLAAKGLSAVYNLSTEKLRKDMVSSLIRNLTSSKAKATASVVAGDEGTMEIGHGDGPSSYKEMVSICNDMGQPELIYKFLDIAGHGAVWNNRRGAALVGETIFQSEVAAEQLKPHFGNLFPKLYMYSYDPATGVRMSMNAILKSLTIAVGYSSVMAALDAHLAPSLDFLLESMGSRQWRIREGATMALRDAIPSRKFSSVKGYIERIWYMVFRVMDDIKESVRAAAQGCARAAVSLSSRLCNPRLTGTRDAEQAALLIVPICLKGYTVGVKETQQISVTLLTEIIKDGGESLKDLVPSIVQCLLSAATELEPAMFNYAQFHTDSPSELESARADAAASSRGVVMSSLERILPLIDSGLGSQLTPILVNLVRTAVGIPSRVATAQFISSLMGSNKLDMSQETGKLLDSTMSAVFSERSGPLVKIWASASVNCASAASLAKIGKFFNRINEEGMSDDEKRRLAAATLCLVLSNRRPELLKQNGTKVLPVSFISKNLDSESEKDTAEMWRLVWDDNVSSQSGAARTYAQEIIDMGQTWLSSRSHLLKRAAAKSLAKLVNVLAQSELSADRRAQLLKIKTVLIESLRGKAWEGKDSVVSSLSSFADSREADLVNTKLLIQDDTEMVAIFCSEAVRGNVKARATVLSALKKVIDCQPFLKEQNPSDALNRIFDASLSCLMICREQDSESQAAMVVSKIAEFSSKSKGLDYLVNAIRDLSKTWTSPNLDSRKTIVDVCLRCLGSNEPAVFDVVQEWSSAAGGTWKTLSAEIIESASSGNTAYTIGDSVLEKLRSGAMNGELSAAKGSPGI